MCPQESLKCPYTGDDCNTKTELCDQFIPTDKASCIGRLLGPCTCSEHHMKYELKNDDRLCIKKLNIDNCLITCQNSLKCDFAVFVCPSKICCLIELKGSNIDHACEQILDTANIINNILNKCNKIHARIVASKVQSPNIRSTLKTKLDNFCRSHRGTLKIQVRTLQENVSTL